MHLTDPSPDPSLRDDPELSSLCFTDIPGEEHQRPAFHQLGEVRLWNAVFFLLVPVADHPFFDYL